MADGTMDLSTTEANEISRRIESSIDNLKGLEMQSFFSSANAYGNEVHDGFSGPIKSALSSEINSLSQHLEFNRQQNDAIVGALLGARLQSDAYEALFSRIRNGRLPILQAQYETLNSLLEADRQHQTATNNLPDRVARSFGI